jgi:hypothetical protein
MANQNTVFGARYWTNPWGGIATGKVNPYVVIATDATAMFMGDFVKLTGDSDVGPDGVYYPTITQAAATDLLVGFVVGFQPHPDYLTQLYRTASTLRIVWVCDDPNAHFEIQSDGTGAKEDIGLNADIVVAAGSTNTGLSGMQLNHADLKTATAQLRIVRLSPNSEFGAYTKFICFINEHAYKGTVGV